jgi:hypothetical protein
MGRQPEAEGELSTKAKNISFLSPISLHDLVMRNKGIFSLVVMCTAHWNYNISSADCNIQSADRFF